MTGQPRREGTGPAVATTGAAWPRSLPPVTGLAVGGGAGSADRSVRALPGAAGAGFLSLRLRLWARREAERIGAGRARALDFPSEAPVGFSSAGALRAAGDCVVGVGRPRCLCRHHSAVRQPPPAPLRQHLQYCWWPSSPSYSYYSSRSGSISSVAAFRRSALRGPRPVRCARGF